eukprot:scaffold22705_cov73-Skeletonema_dohrnii-CCMP3373.AAC.1
MVVALELYTTMGHLRSLRGIVIVVLGSRRDVLVKEVRSTCTIRITPVRPQLGGVFSVSRPTGCGCGRRLEAQVIALVKQDNYTCLVEKVGNVLDIVLYVLTAHLHEQETDGSECEWHVDVV